MKVWVNGTFDVLHIGHLRLLKYASTLGTVRAGLDEDSRVRELKGVNRPFNCFAVRKEFLESLRFVEEVVGFDSEDSLIDQLKNYRPDIMVIGSDYINKKIIGAQYINKVVYFETLNNISTTSILEYEKNNCNR
jgi:cytidyltransferase-like protein